MPLLSDNPYLAASLALNLLNIVLLTVVFSRFRSYQKRQDELVKGEEIPDLMEIGKILEELVENNQLNIQRAGVVRFNPFVETGGNLSFAIALLDGKNNGIVISSLHSREGTRVYAKSIQHGESQRRLTEEEEQAIKQANQ